MARESSYKPRRSEELATREVGVEENTDACSVSQLEDAILEQLATLSNATSSAEAENQLPISSANRNVEPDDRCGISSCIENIDVSDTFSVVFRSVLVLNADACKAIGQ